MARRIEGAPFRQNPWRPHAVRSRPARRISLKEAIMAVRHTVSEEMAWTDWSAANKADVRPEPANRTTPMGLVIGLVLAVVALAGIVYLLPPGVN